MRDALKNNFQHFACKSEVQNWRTYALCVYDYV